MLFNKIGSDLIAIKDLKFYHINSNTIHELDKFYKKVRVNKMTANATQGLLMFGMNNYWCIYNGWLVLCHIYRGVISLVTFPFNDSGFMNFDKIISFMRYYGINRVRWVLDSYFKGNDVALVNNIFRINKLYYEYVIDTEKLSKLIGGEYKHIRQDCNRLLRKYDINYRICSFADRKLIEYIYSIWCDKSGSKYRIYDKVYLFNMFNIAPEKFLIFFDKNKPIGFINYYEINSRSVYCGLIKFDKDYKSISKYMEHILAVFLYDNGYRYMNIDADDNSKGLADFKNSLKPVYKMMEYELYLK